MRIVCTTHALEVPAGTETYVLTLAAALERLGHEVWLHAWRTGEIADSARERGLRVAATEQELPADCDAVVANLTDVAYDLTTRYPSSVHAYVCHGVMHQISTPPQVPGAVDAMIVLNDRVRRWAAGLATAAPATRLRQPVDLDRFAPRGSPRRRAKRLLLLGNYTQGARRDMVHAVCAELGIEVVRVGGDRASTRPELAIADADVVMGYGRCIVEAMAAGRAAYVYDRHGGDGWVTPESYERLESDGFGGQATPMAVDAARLRADLGAYRPEMGTQNRDLAVLHHASYKHAAAVAKLLDELAEQPAALPDAPWRELSRLVRQLWDAEVRALVLQRDVGDLQARVAALEAERDAARAAADALTSTRRYRASTAIARPLDAARRKLRRD